jgi:hypothetical protein
MILKTTSGFHKLATCARQAKIEPILILDSAPGLCNHDPILTERGWVCGSRF